MGEFEDRVNSILNDPTQMEKITNLAKSLMGGDGGPAEKPPADADGLDVAALGRISRLLSAGSAGDDNQRALLEAMKPYLSPKRREKMDRALRLAKVAKIARLAMGEMGGDGDV